ncbi:MAG: hypothetical protein HKN87_00905 [Saprospiraceae bacterium]|nr:hypothetical protein [Saprospiraceae bacterium]
MSIGKNQFIGLLFILFLPYASGQEPISISGIYPHLAYYNKGGECGTGAVVPWAGRLWVVTYSPHFPHGSSDKLYEITPSLELKVREESIGGTPANRMIHRESNQLFIGPHAIDKNGKVRTIPYDVMQGRHTGNARHLTDPTNYIYYGTMEEGFYDVGVSDLAVKMLYRDGNKDGKVEHYNPTEVNPENATLPGAHGKGLYSGQGVVVYSNNGEATEEALKKFDIESGALAEWDGKSWKVVRRNQFVEVTGPGGIYGNSNPATDPIWATGWDHKSVILGVRDPDGWSFFRLPKASHSYDGAHGWNTEWPRIRNVGTEMAPDYLMTMHGMFWQFPKDFASEQTSGIRPRSAYLKVIGDFTRWNDQLVFGCDDSAQKEFLNKRKQKGGIEGPGQSNSNLWFTSINRPDELGPHTAHGAVWLKEEVQADERSEPFLFAGWPERTVWIYCNGDEPTKFEFEVDRLGNNIWTPLVTVAVEPQRAKAIHFDQNDVGEWIRVKSNAHVEATVSFNYAATEKRAPTSSGIFEGLAICSDRQSIGGQLYGLGKNRRTLGVNSQIFSGRNKRSIGYYELDEHLKLEAKDDEETRQFIEDKFAIPKDVISVEASSVLVVDDQGRRWRFPRGIKDFSVLTKEGALRICREVATERDLFNCHGTFYELPAENADGFAKVRPIASHQFRIHDYASYRGMLVMTGISPDQISNPHVVRSTDGKAAVWVGVIDDLWELGKPIGQGGPWLASGVEKDVPSDPYLIGFYDRRSLVLTNHSNEEVTFRIQIDPVGHGPWMNYLNVVLDPGQEFAHDFAGDFEARWIRFVANKDCQATAWLTYQ